LNSYGVLVKPNSTSFESYSKKLLAAVLVHTEPYLHLALSSSGPFSGQWAEGFASVHGRPLVFPPRCSRLLLHVDRHEMVTARCSLAGLFFFCHQLVSSLLQCELGVLLPSEGCVLQTGISTLLQSCNRLCPVMFQ